MVVKFFFKSWAEFFFFVLMVVGVIVSLASPSAVISYFIIFISGMMAGRILAWRQHSTHFAYLLIIMGFLIGFVIGSYYGNRKVIIILFALGAFLAITYIRKRSLGILSSKSKVFI